MIQGKVYSVSMQKTKAGDNAIVITVVTDDNDWIRDFIGYKAPSFVSKRWWELLGAEHGWDHFTSQSSFDLVGLTVLVELEDSDYGKKIKKVELPNKPINTNPPGGSADSPVTTIPESEIPF